MTGFFIAMANGAMAGLNVWLAGLRHNEVAALNAAFAGALLVITAGLLIQFALSHPR